MNFHPVIAQKLAGIDPKNIIVLADYDLTLANKCTKFFHNAPLQPAHLAGIALVADHVHKFWVVTARGETSTLEYLQAPIPYFLDLPNEPIYVPDNVGLASNSGHRIRDSVISGAPHRYLNIPSYRGEAEVAAIAQRIAAVVEDISDRVTAGMKRMNIVPQSVDFKFCVDPRELCGAYVYQFHGELNNPLHQLVTRAFGEAIPADMLESLTRAEKSIASFNAMNQALVQGYVDLAPKGMTKGVFTQNVFASSPQDTFYIVAGDSKPDLAMMKTLADAGVPETRRLFISVGNGLVQPAQEIGLKLDAVLLGNGITPVEEFHSTILRALAEPKIGRMQPVPQDWSGQFMEPIEPSGCNSRSGLILPPGIGLGGSR